MNGRPRRSDATKATILAAARDRFTADGYERATIRAIAADADIDPAMVMRYFGNKEQLFVAAAEVDLRLPDVTRVARRRIGQVLAAHFVDLWEDHEGMAILLRAAATNESAADRAKTVLREQIMPMVAALEPDPQLAATRAGMVGSQVLGIALCRYVLRLPPVAAMSTATMTAWLAPTLQRYLTAPAPVIEDQASASSAR